MFYLEKDGADLYPPGWVADEWFGSRKEGGTAYDVLINFDYHVG